MHPTKTQTIRLTAGLALLISGCAGVDFGGEIHIPESQMHVLPPAGPDPTPILLPGDRTFNVHQTAGSRIPGPEGSAREDAAALPDGAAFCLIEAADGGSANAEFKLGHRLENRTDQAITANIQVEFDLAYTIAASPEPVGGTLATANLHLAVLDARNRPLASLPVAQLTSDTVSADSTTTERHRLSAVIGPHRNATILLYGRVSGASISGQNASARMDVKNLRMRLEITEGPPASAPAGTAEPSPEQ